MTQKNYNKTELVEVFLMLYRQISILNKCRLPYGETVAERSSFREHPAGQDFQIVFFRQLHTTFPSLLKIFQNRVQCKFVTLSCKATQGEIINDSIKSTLLLVLYKDRIRFERGSDVNPIRSYPCTALIVCTRQQQAIYIKSFVHHTCPNTTFPPLRTCLLHSNFAHRESVYLFNLSRSFGNIPSFPFQFYKRQSKLKVLAYSTFLKIPLKLM